MTRLPVVSSDNNAWGTILNAFLAVSHDASGNIVVAQGQAFSIIDGNGATLACLKIDGSNNLIIQAPAPDHAIIFNNGAGSTALIMSSAVQLPPGVPIAAFDGSFNYGQILGLDGSNNTLLQAHPTGGSLRIADSSGNVAWSTKQSATTPDTGNNGTISTTGIGLARVTPAANRTGVILQAGVTPTQEVTVVNNSTSFSITFDVVGTSHVADGVSAVIAANKSMSFIWDSVASKWYHT
jgi:hypothetical protein